MLTVRYLASIEQSRNDFFFLASRLRSCSTPDSYDCGVGSGKKPFPVGGRSASGFERPDDG